MKKYVAIILAVLLVGLSSCDLSELLNFDKLTPSAPTPPTPEIENSSGTMVSIISSFSYTNKLIAIPVELVTETATAVFPKDGKSDEFSNVGEVSVNDFNLKMENKSKVYMKITTELDDEDLNFSSGVKWKVPDLEIDYNHGGVFPKYTGTLAEEISRSEDFKINFANKFSGSPDQVLVLIASGKKTITKIVEFSDGSLTIPSSELKDLPKASNKSGFLEIVPIKINSQKIAGKEYYFVKEYVHAAAIDIN